jgi:predicted ATPase
MAAGLSQEALAERARISTEAVGSLERGSRRAPQRQTLALLIDALKVEGAERLGLEQAALRPSLPRRRETGPSVAGVASALRVPAPLTSFVGREDDLETLEAAMSDARLVSLVGPGGVGKSRLALEAARRCSDRFPEGVVLVELAPLAAGASVISAFATALGVADEGDVPPLARVVAACGQGRRLILADNCEHVLDACAEVVFALLNGCPNVRLMATSREPLRVTGEQILRLGPLAPDAALQLFVSRAKAVAPQLRFDPHELQLAAQICRRVDGIPLAIELAASRTDIFDLETILKRLGERFKLLAAGSRTTLPQHRTLRALVDWSHELLEPDEARVFRRLGMFAGGCRVDDAEHILAFEGITPDQVWELLARLHDKSLVDVDRTDPPRFSMLQTIHDYAKERLADSNETAELSARYATHYLELSVAADAPLRSALQGETIDRLSAEVDNIRAALALSGANPALRELGLAASGSLSHYWMRTGGLTEGLNLIESLTGNAREPSRGLASACAGGAFIEFNRRRFSAGGVYAERAYEAATACGDEWLTIYSANAICSARSALGGRPDAIAASTYERAKQIGDPWLIAGAAFQLGFVAINRGDRVSAARHFFEGLERARATGDQFIVMTSSLRLGQTLTESEPVRAAQLIVDAIGFLRPGAILARTSCIESLAAIALFLKRADDAARLAFLGAALRSTTGEQPNVPRMEAVRAAAPDVQPGGQANASLADANDAIHSFLTALS